MAAQHVFLSYIREDAGAVDELQGALESAGFSVWRDVDQLWPGDNWEAKIRDAIRTGSLVFIACFSSALGARDVSYQYKELMIAADEYTLRPLDTSWLMTVRFDESPIPPVDLGGGRTLDRTIHRADLFGKQKLPNMTRLAMAVQRVVGNTPPMPAGSVGAAVSATKRADSAEAATMDRLRGLLRQPELELDFDEFMRDVRDPILAALKDRDRFPMSGAAGQLSEDTARTWVARLRAYDDLLAPGLPLLRLIGMYSRPGHLDAVTKTIAAIAQECSQTTGVDLLREVHEYPTVLMTYTLGFGALTKSNYTALKAATVDVQVRQLGRDRRPFLALHGPRTVVGEWRWLGTLLNKTLEDGDFDTQYFDDARSGRIGARYTPISDHLFGAMNPVFANDFASDEDYADAFDEFEVLLDAFGEHERGSGGFGGRTVYGRHTWRQRHTPRPTEVVLQERLNAAGGGWTPLLAGLFDGNADAATTALDAVADAAQSMRVNRS
ncbi:toll/interleukin-1 receptor domain-containing protein [Curtobacterium sp. PhB136]|uniref:toll/interleukin-1 receptor domain-containing protein n=1 Tax=Curtobacterium sp. PhB136 TaxID=2485181 RepID=UPI00140464C4|nr:toll/interleukin-1 receptor domain-containing protein [Curtobacterium sp. PhB136]